VPFNSSKHIQIDRKFWPLEKTESKDPETIRAMIRYGLGQIFLWSDLLNKKRVVILAEPGTGKSAEFQMITKQLKEQHKHAFLCRIELLQSMDFRESLDIGTAEEFDKWLSENENGYFFLDSVDEARLQSHLAFEHALRRFAKNLSGQLKRAKIFISCRVSNWRATADLSLFLKHLPLPRTESVLDSTDNNYMEGSSSSGAVAHSDKSFNSEEGNNEQFVFKLTPLDRQQIKYFAAKKRVNKISDFIEAIERADADIFAERPQDLKELIYYWKKYGRLGSH